MELTDIKSVNKAPTDPRLRSEKFKRSVRVVLDYLGLNNNMGNFKKYDEKYGSPTPINWEKFAYNIEHKGFEAMVEILQNGNPTYRTGLKKLYGETKEEALKTLDTKNYKFERWW